MILAYAVTCRRGIIGTLKHEFRSIIRIMAFINLAITIAAMDEIGTI
jgi:hypothetical protein